MDKQTDCDLTVLQEHEPECVGNRFVEDEEVLVGWRTWMAVLAGVSCVFSGYYTGLMLGNTATTIMTQFGRSDLITFMPNSYAIITAALGGLIAKMSDICGRKWFLIGGLAIACLGNVILAAAQNYGAALAGAALSAGIFCNQGNFFSIAAEVLPRRYRGLGSTITVSAGGFGAVLSLTFNGYTDTNNTGGLSWRSGYILGACIHILSAVLLFCFYKPLESPKEPGITLLTALRTKVDWVGAFILASGYGFLMVGLSIGGTLYPWKAPTTLALLVVGAVLCGVLALHQIFIVKNGTGIMDKSLWTRNYTVCWFGLLVEGIVFFSFLLFFPLENTYLGWATSTFQSDIRLLAFFGVSAIIAPFVGYYTRRTRDLKYPLIIGWALVLISNIVFSVLGADGGNASIAALTVCGVGFATPLALLFAAAQLATPPHLLGLATGQLISARAIGQAIGASVLEAIFEAKLAVLEPEMIVAAALKAGLPESSLTVFVTGIATGNVTLAESAPGVTAAILEAGGAAATSALVKSFHYGWYTCIAFVAISLASIFVLSGRKMKAQMTWLIERPITAITHIQRTEGVDPEKRHSFARHSKESGRRTSLKVG